MNERDRLLIANAKLLYTGEARERELISPRIVWHVPGHNPVSGEYRGSDDYFGTMVARMSPLDRWDFSLQSLMVNGDLVVTRFHVKGERKGKQVDLDGSHVIRFDSSGKIVEGWGFTDDQDALDAFFS
jgi:ketosteroid isomerase-like protein